MIGYLQVYTTGNGKGKTTAALGLSIRAAGAGLKVFIVQFLKMGDYSEIKALERFSDLITIEQYGLSRFVKGKPSPEDIKAGRKGLEKLKSIIAAGEHDVVVIVMNYHCMIKITCQSFQAVAYELFGSPTFALCFISM